MENYVPIKIINANLEDSEIHFYSFAVVPFEKTLFGYSPSACSYTMHLTDKRLIVEPDINAELLEKFYKPFNLMPFGRAGTYRAKHMSKEGIKKMYYLKYTSISINSDEIEKFSYFQTAFNTNLVHILLKLDSDERNLDFFRKLGLEVFQPSPIKEIKLNEIWQSIEKKGLKIIGMEFLKYIKKMRKIDSASDFVSQADLLLQLYKIPV
ncbi:MAG TPA: hypothetical protein IGS40_23470 [Trichormus sp. M33_DOE_039]|nr:hypothetical protein [Trichormus sp. M33_DOE_039]